MRALALSALLALLAAGPALAGDPRGVRHHRPPPAYCCSQGVSSYVDVDARVYDTGVVRTGGYGGGTIYFAGGYGGMGYGYVGAPAYYEVDRRTLACASAPFGYVVEGFGRDGRRPPSCGGYHAGEGYGYDRGGRYGYSERHDSYEERSYELYESYEESSYEEYGAYEAYRRDRRDCDCREPAPYPPPYLPEPPRYEPPPPPRAHPPRPHRPRREPPPRQQYRQEPGERG